MMDILFSSLRKIHNSILDLLYPISCIHCKSIGEWICNDCLAKIPLKNEQVCPSCEKRITPDGQTCFQCLGKSPLDGILVACEYGNEILKSAIHLYKYRFIHGLHNPLGIILVKCFEQSSLPIPEIIIPIPLHPHRLRWRGFNQSKLIANHLGKKLLANFEIPVGIDILIRKRYTQPQKSISNHSDRNANISGAFSVAKTEAIKGKRILIIDDVATTGATLFECAKMLKQAGAKSVHALVLARQQIQNH